MADKIKMAASELAAASKKFSNSAQNITSILNISDKNITMLKQTWSGDAPSEFMREYDTIRKGLEKYPVMLIKYAKYFETTSKGLTSADTKAANSMKSGKGTSSSKKAAKKEENLLDKTEASVSPGGKLYHAVKIGSSVAKIVGGLLLIGAIAPEEFFTGGAATPAAVLQATYGVNSIANGVRDLDDCYDGDYEDVGKKNYLQDGAEGVLGSATNKFLGNKQVGETAGDLVYDAGDFFTGSRGFSKLVGAVAAPKYIVLGKLPYEIGRFGSKVNVGYSNVVIVGPSLIQKANSVRKIVSTVKSDASDVIDMGNNVVQPSGN